LVFLQAKAEHFFILKEKLKNGEGRALRKAESARQSWQSAAQTRTLQTGLKKTKRAAWVNAVLPFNVALGPVGTLIQLLILNINGTVIGVSLAISLFNAVSVPAAIIWGFVTDRFHRRKPIIVVSYLVTAGILVSFLFASTGYLVSLLYALFSLVSSASTTP
jgi:MFS family permease